MSNEMKRISLTASQIDWYGRLIDDERGTKRALEVAMMSYANRISQMREQWDELFEELAKSMGLHYAFGRIYTDEPGYEGKILSISVEKNEVICKVKDAPKNENADNLRKAMQELLFE